MEFSNRITDWNVNASFGSTGDCYDNAAMESTWAAPISLTLTWRLGHPTAGDGDTVVGGLFALSTSDSICEVTPTSDRGPPVTVEADQKYVSQ